MTVLSLLCYFISNFDISSATGNCYFEWYLIRHLLYGYSYILTEPLDFFYSLCMISSLPLWLLREHANHMVLFNAYAN